MIWSFMLNLVGLLGCISVVVLLLILIGALAMMGLELLGLDYDDVPQWAADKFERWRNRKNEE